MENVKLSLIVILLLSTLIGSVLSDSIDKEEGGGGEEEEETKSKYELLCKNEKAKLRTLSQVKKIIKLVESNQYNVECSENIKDAIKDIGLVISDENTNGICTAEKVELIRQYHTKYFNSLSEHSVDFPSALKNFFLGYGFRISDACKRQMKDNLIQDSKEAITEEDLKSFEVWLKMEDTSVKNVIGNAVDYDDLFLISDVSSYTDNDGVIDFNEKTIVQTKMTKTIKHIQSICRQKFKPFYDKLILPLVRLSNLGFYYKNKDYEQELFEFRQNEELRRWYKIVFLCESLLVIEPIELEEDHGINRSSVGGENKATVNILTKEQVEEYFKKHGPITNEDDFVSVNYEPNTPVTIDDTIVDTKNSHLCDAILHFDTKRMENDYVHDRMMSKFTSFVKNSFLTGKVGIGGSIGGVGVLQVLEKYVESKEDSLNESDTLKDKSNRK